MNKEKEYILEMLKNMEIAKNNASQFGDDESVKAINLQIDLYKNRLKELDK